MGAYQSSTAISHVMVGNEWVPVTNAQTVTEGVQGPGVLIGGRYLVATTSKGTLVVPVDQLQGMMFAP